MISGVPAHVDGRMIQITQKAGGSVINPDRMWHYTEGIQNWDPIWPMHGIRILPGPSSLWLDATGNRLPVPLFPGLRHARHARAHHAHGPRAHLVHAHPEDHREEFALSGSEQNPDITDKSVRRLIETAVASGAPAPVEAFKEHGADFVVERDLRASWTRHEPAHGRAAARLRAVEAEVIARDREMDNPFTKDLQVTAIHGARRYLADRLTRVAARTSCSTPDAGPLIGVKLHILTRKTLGGLQTDLDARVLDKKASPCPACTPRRGGRLRRRGHARLPRTRGHLPRRLHLLRPNRRPRRRRGAALISAAASSAPGSATRRRSRSSGSSSDGAPGGR
jgi:predicted oxidoreductase